MNNENRFYVYVHKIRETGEIFYVGKGTAYRMNSRHGRSTPWLEITSSNEWYPEIYMDNLSSDDACTIEVELIGELAPRGNVQRKDTSYREVDYRDFLSVYYYDETSPSGLRYVSGNRQSGHKKRIAGDPAGTLLKSGYYSVHYKYSNYFAHRVVWCLVNKCSIKKELIDHIDKNRSNNRIQNLRSVGTPENCKNIHIKSNNKTGYTGVSYLASFNIYLSTWTDRQGVSYSKSFSALKHGNELALALAAEYRNRVATEDTGYLQDHGYLQPSILSNYSENQIQEMFDCDLSASNNSGISRVYFQSVRGNSFWNYSGGSNVYRFSCTKYGYDKARELAIEYKDFIEKEIDFQSLSADLKSEIDNPLSASNQTGFRNMSFIGEHKDKILVQVMIDYKNNTKTFNTRKLGLIPAIAAAEQWRDKMKNNTDGGYFGA